MGVRDTYHNKHLLGQSHSSSVYLTIQLWQNECIHDISVAGSVNRWSHKWHFRHDRISSREAAWADVILFFNWDGVIGGDDMIFRRNGYNERTFQRKRMRPRNLTNEDNVDPAWPCLILPALLLYNQTVIMILKPYNSTNNCQQRKLFSVLKRYVS